MGDEIVYYSINLLCLSIKLVFEIQLEEMNNVETEQYNIIIIVRDMLAMPYI